MEIFSIPVLQVALSVVICWALFSIMCSMIHESAVQIKAERGRYFKTQLLNQLADFPNDINWGLLLYMNPRIDLLSRAYNKPPSEISPRAFAESLVEAVANSHLTQSIKNIEKNEGDSKNEEQQYKSILLQNFKYAVTNLAPSDVISFLKQSLVKAELIGKEDENAVYNELVASVENWYQELTSRVSIWYEKKTRTRLFALGFLIAVILNIDSIKLFNYFNQNPQAREAIFNFYQQNAEKLEMTADITKSDTLSAQFFMHKMDSIKKAAELPIGWSMEKDKPKLQKSCNCEYCVKHNNNCHNQTTTWQQIKHWLEKWSLKLIGFIITAFAAGAGAPFWFNILKKVYPTKTTKA